MQDEINFVNENDIDDPMQLPKGKRGLKNKWIFKLKAREDECPPRYKAHIVVKGFQQKNGVVFYKIVFAMVKMSSIQTILSLIASINLVVKQLDVKTAFLHGELEEEIYMESFVGH